MLEICYTPCYNCYVVTVHQRVGNGTFVVTPLGYKNVYYVSPNMTVVLIQSTDMPARSLGSLLVL